VSTRTAEEEDPGAPPVGSEAVFAWRKKERVFFWVVLSQGRNAARFRAFQPWADMFDPFRIPREEKAADFEED